MLWLLSHIRREKTRQIQRCPHAIVRRDIWLCSAQTKRDLSTPMGLEQIKQDRKAVEIPPGNYPTQAIRIPIQIGAYRRRAASVQKTDRTRRTRAIDPTKPISLEPFTRIIQVFLAPSMIQQSLNLGIRKAEPTVTHQVESGVVRQYEQPCKESAASAGRGHSPIRHVSRNESPAVAMASKSTRSNRSAESAPEAPLALARPNHAASYPSTSNTTCSSQAISSSSMSTPSTESTSSALATPRATRSM